VTRRQRFAPAPVIDQQGLARLSDGGIGKISGLSGHGMGVMQRGALLAIASVDGIEGRAARFEAVFTAHSGVIYAYARRRVTKEEAEDVVSEAFLVAWRRLDDLPAEPVPWLIGVARNVLANRRRADNRRAALGERLRRTSATARVADPGGTPATDDRVLGALAALPPGQREVIELVAWEGLTPSEVAAALEIARATVYVRLHRARQRLARVLEECDENLS
jgi:RNA polymerase sigma-70 factor, ECF subfamily